MAPQSCRDDCPAVDQHGIFDHRVLGVLHVVLPHSTRRQSLVSSLAPPLHHLLQLFYGGSLADSLLITLVASILGWDVAAFALLVGLCSGTTRA